MNHKKYVPDISSFFSEKTKLTLDDIVKLPPIEQETVSFERNDLYSGSVQRMYCRNVNRKRRRYKKIKRTYP